MHPRHEFLIGVYEKQLIANPAVDRIEFPLTQQKSGQTSYTGFVFTLVRILE